MFGDFEFRYATAAFDGFFGRVLDLELGGGALTRIAPSGMTKSPTVLDDETNETGLKSRVLPLDQLTGTSLNCNGT